MIHQHGRYYCEMPGNLHICSYLRSSVNSRQPAVVILFRSLLWFCINECKARSKCIHSPTFQHSSLVSSLGLIRCCSATPQILEGRRWGNVATSVTLDKDTIDWGIKTFAREVIPIGLSHSFENNQIDKRNMIIPSTRITLQ